MLGSHSLRELHHRLQGGRYICTVQLALFDTAGQEEYRTLRPFAYVNAHVILIGFSVDTLDTFNNATHKVGYFYIRYC
jgi:Rho family, other